MVEVNSYAPGSPAWTDLATPGAERAQTFYSALFGWEIAIGGAEVGGYTYCLSRGKRVAGMIPATLPAGVWTTYLATDDVNAAAERFRAAGGTVTMGPADAGPAGRVVVGTDPTGASIGIWQAREHLGAELINEPGAPVWNELRTDDLDAAAAFYSEVFGFTWDDTDTGGGGPQYRTFSVGGQLAGGAMQNAHPGPERTPSYWLPYFAVADTDAAVESAQRLGGRCVQTPMDSPYGRLAVLQDAQSATFATVTTPAETFG